jgi:ATP-binding cassette, subfamily C, bacterial
MTLNAGERVAIVGSTGSGKTTLAKLVAGVREPIGRIRTTVERNDIAYLSQEGRVFSATLRENLALAAPGASDEDLHAALSTVCADALVTSLPDGLDTVLGEEGRRLSGADAQLLALARLVLHDPQVAILDEATAEADSRNASLLDEATSRALAGRAAIVIAHRLSQARVCHRIIVLEKGKVIEEGSHDELLSACGRYSRLWSTSTASR